MNNLFKYKKNKWEIISASVVGNGHLKNNTPCQDSYLFKTFNNSCGIAIVSDGAGSCKNSDKGSKFIVERYLKIFEKVMYNQKWNNVLPSASEWRKYSITITKILVDDLKTFANSHNYQFESLSSTLIVLFYNELGCCTLNIGDGRGAVKINNTWESVVKPYHGEQANTTCFITSSIWNNLDVYIYTKVINKPIQAFLLLTDGYEKLTFECYVEDSKGMYSDPNQPFEKFINDFKYKNIKNALLAGKTVDEINNQWIEFLKHGHEALINETDDKTFIFGLLLD